MDELQHESKPEFVPYPRAEAETQPAIKLRALSKAYFGMNRVFALNIALLLLCFALVGPGSKEARSDGLVAIWLAVPIIIGLAAYPVAKKASFGAGWSSGTAMITAILIGLNALFCWGLVGYFIFQYRTTRAMEGYGVRGSLMRGYNRALIEFRIAKLEEEDRAF